MKTLVKKRKRKNLQKEWNDVVDFWSSPKVESPVFYKNTKEVEKGMQDVIAWMNMQERRAYFNMPVLDKKVGRNNFKPTGSHEVGHDAFCPYNLKMCLLLTHAADKVLRNKKKTQFVENIFSDTMVNTRMVDKGDKSIVDVYKRLSVGNQDSKFWNVYMNTCERLWDVPKGTLSVNMEEEMTCDAEKLEDIIKKAIYADDVYNKWPNAMKEFAKVMKKYTDDPNDMGFQSQQCDSCSSSSGQGGNQPDPQNQPGNDPAQGSQGNQGNQGNKGNQGNNGQQQKNPPNNNTPETPSGVIDYHSPKDFAPVNPKNAKDRDVEAELEKAVRGVARKLGPKEFKRLMSNSGLVNSKKALTWFYRDIAHQFDVQLPYAETDSGGSIPSGVGVWDLNDPFPDLDVLMSCEQGPFLPGETTRKKIRDYIGDLSGKGGHPDIMVCLDCSGSMPDPTRYMSVPVLSSMVVAHAALRSERKVSVVLFSHIYDVLEYTKDRNAVDEKLTNFLTGGTLIPAGKIYDLAHSNSRPQHIVLISDTEIYNLDKQNLSYLENALQKAGAGGTVFLNNRAKGFSKQLKKIGYNVIKMNETNDLLGLTLDLRDSLYGG